jgi:hypothetical protein
MSLAAAWIVGHGMARSPEPCYPHVLALGVTLDIEFPVTAWSPSTLGTNC